jgi:hypothetical protein
MMSLFFRCMPVSLSNATSSGEAVSSSHNRFYFLAQPCLADLFRHESMRLPATAGDFHITLFSAATSELHLRSCNY